MRWIIYFTIPYLLIALLLYRILLIALLLYRILFDDTGLVASWHLDTQIESLEDDIATQQTRKDSLQREVNALRNGHDLLEEKARKELGFVKENESFYLMLD